MFIPGLLWAEPSPPQPYGPLPSERQLRWHEMGFYGFLHFTINTFTDKEWGYGDEGEAVFNPSDLLVFTPNLSLPHLKIHDFLEARKVDFCRLPGLCSSASSVGCI